MKPLHLVLFATALTCACCSRNGAADESDRLPNLVVVFTDNQGYQDVGCFGSPDIRTPCLDSMAIQGMKFTSFYAQLLKVNDGPETCRATLLVDHG